jgi:hypothetical protein
MTPMTPTQEDREAAAEYFRAWHEPLETMAVEALGGRHDDDPDSLVQAFTRHRLAAEERGKRMEREQIVAWLRSIADDFDKAAKASGLHQLSQPIETIWSLADAITLGEHTAIRQIDPASLGAE